MMLFLISPGQDVAEVCGLDAHQTVDQANLDVTPVCVTTPVPILQPGPLDHGTTSNAQETGEEPQLAGQSSLQQDRHESHVTEFSLLVGF